ncbi:hypothetical protein BJA01nite_82790 [Bradyrhizobium japonicum]|nr:hypothetical protein BJ6T_31830 [Bradyrhizobium japonicum USDA 6]GEC50637.1 hypothetical protein BJA01nite_82790 [Bradyrhizobium japonicum]
MRLIAVALLNLPQAVILPRQYMVRIGFQRALVPDVREVGVAELAIGIADQIALVRVIAVCSPAYGTELNCSNAASFVMPAGARRHPAVSERFTMPTNDPNFGRISVTTAEPTTAVARDQVIDRVADHPWDEMEDPCPL